MWSAPVPTRQVAAAVPHGVRIYAVRDIHGRADLLSSALRGIGLDCRRRPADRPITVFVGDYIDRGPNSRAVLDLLLRWREDNEAVFIRGNHETFLPRFLANSRTLDAWRQNGGLETLLSYGLRPTINPDRHEQVRLADELARALPREHLEFLESLNLSFSCGDISLSTPASGPVFRFKSKQKMICLWIRDEFLAHEQAIRTICRSWPYTRKRT